MTLFNLNSGAIKKIVAIPDYLQNKKVYLQLIHCINYIIYSTFILFQTVTYRFIIYDKDHTVWSVPVPNSFIGFGSFNILALPGIDFRRC